MAFHTILTEVQESGVAILRLNRPARLNALSVQMRREVSRCLADWRDDAAVGAVILTGEGRSFSAGFELEEFRDPELRAEVLDSSTRYHRDVWYFPKPTIAAVNGLAVGGGFDLATLCDLRIASEAAWFSHPELAHGAPPLFTPLSWIVGGAVARDLCLTRRRLTALEAERLGLVTDVVAADELLGEARRLARRVLEAPAGAVRYFKEVVATGCGRSFDAAFAEEHDRAFREVILRPEMALTARPPA
ncbi:MAG: enoyl-CoA hydratase/isomerase family protein [Deltaproteobacteria bacterium]|nr:enoyl-CoA hydratase/isomerase family protein [Deltaproteobacteria bacterium]